MVRSPTPDLDIMGITEEEYDVETITPTQRIQQLIDTEDEEEYMSLLDNLLEDAKRDNVLEEILRGSLGGTAKPDQLPDPNIGVRMVGGGKKKGFGLGDMISLGSKFLGGPAAVGLPYPVNIKEGGSIKKAKKKKKRVVRGVGAAKRGYGKATYSKKMY
tara:strand:+ start:878 stop:1354 length:477 start_codon:yes stop_codon:yes gene_type:complete